MDELWHAAILDTQFYAHLQDALDVILHHRPSGASETEARENRLAAMKSVYTAFFGGTPLKPVHSHLGRLDGRHQPQRAADLRRRPENSIFVKSLTGTVTMIKVSANGEEHIGELKTKIELVQGTPVELQRLVFRGRALEDSETLASYGIGNDSTLHLILRQLGC